MSKSEEEKLARKKRKNMNLTVLFFIALFGAIIASIFISFHNYFATNRQLIEQIVHVAEHQSSGNHFSNDLLKLLILKLL